MPLAHFNVSVKRLKWIKSSIDGEWKLPPAEAIRFEMKQIIYVALLDEGTPCWRPVEAIHKHDDIYTIIGKNPDPEDEHWEFSCGEDVRCQPYPSAQGSTRLTAYAKAT